MRLPVLVFAIATTLYGAPAARAQFSFSEGDFYSKLIYTPRDQASYSLLTATQNYVSSPPSASYTLPRTIFNIPDGNSVVAGTNDSYTLSPGSATAWATSYLSVAGPTSCQVEFDVIARVDWTATPGLYISSWYSDGGITGYASDGDTVYCRPSIQAEGGAYYNNIYYYGGPGDGHDVEQTGGGAVSPWWTPANGVYYASDSVPYIGPPSDDVVSLTIIITHNGGDSASWLDWGDPGAGLEVPAAVPEPASLMIWGAGLLGVGAVYLRRRRAKA